MTRRRERHGHTWKGDATPEYRAWRSMLNRCHPNGPYGPKGIEVCDRWQVFSSFFADMGPKPTRKHTLDRIDGTRGYEPGNCRWVTMKEQSRNRRDNRLITWNGESLTAGEWAERTGLSAVMIYRRVTRGWPVEEALTRPPIPRCSQITWRGETRCRAEWAEITGISDGAIRYRLRRGWSVEKALTTPPY